jgi:hypothetical protein
MNMRALNFQRGPLWTVLARALLSPTVQVQAQQVTIHSRLPEPCRSNLKEVNEPARSGDFGEAER